MKLIPKEEYAEMRDIKWGKKSEFTENILTLEANGDALFIPHDEWKKLGYKTTPRKLINCYKYMKQSRLYQQFDLVVERKKEGWIIRRI